MKPTNTDTQQTERDIQASMQSEQAADLAALQAQAMNEDQASHQAPAMAPAGPDLAGEIAGIITVTVQTLGPMFPSLKEVYTKETTEAAAGAVAAVCNKHGWLSGGMFGEYGEEIACLAVCGPLALATYQGISADLAKHKAKAEAKAGALGMGVDLSTPPPAKAPPAPKTVQFGAPVEASP